MKNARGQGRKPEGAIRVIVAFQPAALATIDASRGTLSRGKWIAEKLNLSK